MRNYRRVTAIRDSTERLRKSAWYPFRSTLYRYMAHIYDDTVKSRYIAQQKALECDSNSIYLDIGCQTGENTEIIRAAISTEHVVGIDLNLRTLALARDRGYAVCVSDAGRALPFATDSLDVVTAMDIIEHLTDPAVLIRETHRVLKPGGYCVIATPNLASWHNIFALIMGLQPFSGPNLTSMLDGEIGVISYLHRRAYEHICDNEISGSAHEEPELYRHLVVGAYRSLVSLVRENGFEVESARGFGYYPAFPPFSRWLARLDPSHSHHIVLKARKPRGTD